MTPATLIKEFKEYKEFEEFKREGQEPEFRRQEAPQVVRGWTRGEPLWTVPDRPGDFC